MRVRNRGGPETRCHVADRVADRIPHHRPVVLILDEGWLDRRRLNRLAGQAGRGNGAVLERGQQQGGRGEGQKTHPHHKTTSRLFVRRNEPADTCAARLPRLATYSTSSCTLTSWLTQKK